MTKNQYVNIVKTTVTQNPDKTRLSLDLGKATLKNLGVPFPSGTLEEAITALNTGKYMGWTPCSAQAAEACINNGYTAVAMNSQDMMVLLPGDTSSENTVAAAAEQNMSFYAYATITEENQTATAATINPADPVVYLRDPQNNHTETLNQTHIKIQHPTHIETQILNDHVIPISIEGTNVTKVTAFVNDEPLLDDNLFFEYTVSSAGSYRITAQGENSAGVTVTAPCKTVNVIQPPVVNVDTTAPSVQLLTANHTLPITATGSLCSTLELYVNDTVVETSTTGSISVNHPVSAAGTYTIYARGINSLGYSVTTDPITITIVNVLIALASNDFPQPIYHGLTIPVNYASTNCNQVEFYVNSESPVSMPTTDGLFNYPCNSADTYNIYAVASNEAGERFTSNTVTVTVTDDFVFQNEHFILDAPLKTYITNDTNQTLITPKEFNAYMRHLDLGYKAMEDLMGKTPCNGEPIHITEGDPKNAVQYVELGKNFINWDRARTGDIWTKLKNRPDDWWISGSMHELGHLFDEDGDDKWRFNSEAWATLKAWLAIEKNGGKVYYDAINDNRAPLKYNYELNKLNHVENIITNTDDKSGWRNFLNSGKHGDDIIYLIYPLIQDLGFDTFWNILKNVFRSYYNNTYTEPTYEGSLEQRTVMNFVDRMSYFTSQYLGYTVDVKNYWLDATRERFKNYITDALDTSTPWILLKPIAPKVGDELTFSIFYNKQNINGKLYLQRGGNWNPDFTPYTKSYQSGNSYNCSVGYTINADDIGYPCYIRIIDGSYEIKSNWTNYVQ